MPASNRQSLMSAERAHRVEVESGPRVDRDQAGLRPDHDREVRLEPVLELDVDVVEVDAAALVHAERVEALVGRVLVDDVLGPALARHRAEPEPERVERLDEPVREVELGLGVLVVAAAELAVEVDVVGGERDPRPLLGDRRLLEAAVDGDRARLVAQRDQRHGGAAAIGRLDEPLDARSADEVGRDLDAQVGVAVAAEIEPPVALVAALARVERGRPDAVGVADEERERDRLTRGDPRRARRWRARPRRARAPPPARGPGRSGDRRRRRARSRPRARGAGCRGS